VEDLHEFYEGYIAAFNARDADAFAACFHPPVTMLSGRGALRPGESPCSVVDDPGGFPGQMPAHWSHTTIDAVTALDDVAPFTIAAGLPEPRRRRKGLVTSVSRWDQEGTCYEQVQALYLLSERDGRWGITVVADLGFTRRRSQEPASPERG
jgi:hypothetical protein